MTGNQPPTNYTSGTQPGSYNYAPLPLEPYSRTTYRPTAEQLARDEALKQHNRRSVTIPVVIAAAIAIGLFILLLVLAFGFSKTGQAREFIAGMSAITVILFSIPVIFMMAILPIAYIAWWFNRREQRKLNPETGPMAYRSRVQILLWQVESFLTQSQQQVERGSDAVTEPLIRAHSLWAYGEEMVDGIKQNFTRSEQNDTNNNPQAG
ncbi:MAG: hypothetical protein R3C44_00515 [Chloroflexota bacterium]